MAGGTFNKKEKLVKTMLVVLMVLTGLLLITY